MKWAKQGAGWYTGEIGGIAFELATNVQIGSKRRRGWWFYPRPEFVERNGPGTPARENGPYPTFRAAKKAAERMTR